MVKPRLILSLRLSTEQKSTDCRSVRPRLDSKGGVGWTYDSHGNAAECVLFPRTLSSQTGHRRVKDSHAGKEDAIIMIEMNVSVLGARLNVTTLIQSSSIRSTEK